MDLFLNAHFYVRLGGFTHTQTEISAAEKHLFVNAYLSEGFPKYPIQWICLGWINGAAVNAMTLFVSVRACVSAQRVRHTVTHERKRVTITTHTHTPSLSRSQIDTHAGTHTLTHNQAMHRRSVVFVFFTTG